MLTKTQRAIAAISVIPLPEVGEPTTCESTSRSIGTARSGEQIRRPELGDMDSEFRGPSTLGPPEHRRHGPKHDSGRNFPHSQEQRPTNGPWAIFLPNVDPRKWAKNVPRESPWRPAEHLSTLFGPFVNWVAPLFAICFRGFLELTRFARGPTCQTKAVQLGSKRVQTWPEGLSRVPGVTHRTVLEGFGTDPCFGSFPRVQIRKKYRPQTIRRAFFQAVENPPRDVFCTVFGQAPGVQHVTVRGIATLDEHWRHMRLPS